MCCKGLQIVFSDNYWNKLQNYKNKATKLRLNWKKEGRNQIGLRYEL
jgi:hypothetical protein